MLSLAQLVSEFLFDLVSKKAAIMTTSRFSSARTTFFLAGACALLLTSGCSAFREDSGDKKSGTYKAPELAILDEVPPIAYSEVYAPVDVHAYQQDGKKLPLFATLVLRNPNRSGSLIVKKVDLYGQDGRRIRRVAQEPFELRSFASVEFLATVPVDDPSRRDHNDERDLDSDADARRSAMPSHFIVQWGSLDDASAPLIETVMVDSEGKLLYSRPGHEIRKIPVSRPERPTRQARRAEPSFAQSVHASVAPKYELLRYDSNMGLSPKEP